MGMVESLRYLRLILVVLALAGGIFGATIPSAGFVEYVAIYEPAYGAPGDPGQRSDEQGGVSRSYMWKDVSEVGSASAFVTMQPNGVLESVLSAASALSQGDTAGFGGVESYARIIANLEVIQRGVPNGTPNGSVIPVDVGVSGEIRLAGGEIGGAFGTASFSFLGVTA
jgi:hypothetical protein